MISLAIKLSTLQIVARKRVSFPHLNCIFFLLANFVNSAQNIFPLPPQNAPTCYCLVHFYSPLLPSSWVNQMNHLAKMKLHFFLLPMKNGGKCTHLFFKDASIPQFVGRRQELLTGRKSVIWEMPLTSMIDRQEKPLSFSDVNYLSFVSAHLWTQ